MNILSVFIILLMKLTSAFHSLNKSQKSVLDYKQAKS